MGKIKKEKVCSVCGGLGTFQYDDGTRYLTDICWKCDGRGFIDE